jgi:hypothetical protein
MPTSKCNSFLESQTILRSLSHKTNSRKLITTKFKTELAQRREKEKKLVESIECLGAGIKGEGGREDVEKRRKLMTDKYQKEVMMKKKILNLQGDAKNGKRYDAEGNNQGNQDGFGNGDGDAGYEYFPAV